MVELAVNADITSVIISQAVQIETLAGSINFYYNMHMSKSQLYKLHSEVKERLNPNCLLAFIHVRRTMNI